MLSWWANTKLVLSEDSEDVFLELDQAHRFVCGLFNGGGQPVPDLAVDSSAFHDVVGDSRAAVVTWRVPGQEGGLVGDLRDVKGSRRARLICVRKEHLDLINQKKVTLKIFKFLFSVVNWSYQGC